MIENNGVIDQFIKRYMKEYDYYEQASLTARRLLEGLLQEAGVRAIISNRAKEPLRLLEKVRQRYKPRKHKSVDDFYEEIVDLAGIRIALYFPGERSAVKKIIEQNFEIIGEAKEFPEKNKNKGIEKRFSGYGATHYRVRFTGIQNTEGSRYCDAVIEVQIASVLMHAWSEVEHDLVYKPLDGDLSNSEHQLLDQINGLMIAGEIALEQLQNARSARLGHNNRVFRDHYELADFLAGFIVKNYPDKSNRPSVGNVERVYEHLVRNNINNPKLISEFIQSIDRSEIHGSMVGAISTKLHQSKMIDNDIADGLNFTRSLMKFASDVQRSQNKKHIKIYYDSIINRIRNSIKDRDGEFSLKIVYDYINKNDQLSEDESKKVISLLRKAEEYFKNPSYYSRELIYLQELSNELSFFDSLLSRKLAPST